MRALKDWEVFEYGSSSNVGMLHERSSHFGGRNAEVSDQAVPALWRELNDVVGGWAPFRRIVILRSADCAF